MPSHDVRLPASIEEQWERVAEWHAFLADDQAREYPILDSLNESWSNMGLDFIKRGENLRRSAKTPLATLFFFVEMGLYPPPELLLALLDCWESYMLNAGEIPLEVAFLGPPRKGAGNYSARSALNFRRFMIRIEFEKMLVAGASRTEAAEAVSRKIGNKPDADSILRIMRGVTAGKLFRRPEK